jgi:methionyl-tRNA formyltransferase
MTKYLFLCLYGRAGFDALNLILLRNIYGYDKIIVFTHSENNSLLLDFLNFQRIEFYENSINKSKNIIENKEGFLLSIHYRHIIKEEILQCFIGRSVNLHPSLLPNYRGCFSSVWAIINNEKETGITFHECIPDVDKGNILIQEKIDITDKDTGYSLFHKLITLGVQNLDRLFLLIDKNYMGEPQIGEGSYYKRGVPFEGIINNDWDEEKKGRFIKAIYFPPHPSPIEVPNNNS